MNNGPKFSVITVSYNQGPFIRDNIESVLKQNYSNFEHIIIDAGSTDETLSIIKEYSHLNWISEPDRGQSHGLNKGFRKATGDIIAWLNSDDYYAPNIFNEVQEAMKEHDIVMGDCQFIGKNKEIIENVENVERNFFDILKYWVNFSSPSQPSLFFKKSLLDSVSTNSNFLDENLYYAMDTDLWLKFALKTNFNKYIPKTFSYYRIHEDTKTGGNPLASQKEVEKVFKKHERIIANTNNEISFFLIYDNYIPEVTNTLKSIVEQNYINFDFRIVIYNYNEETELKSDALQNEILNKLPGIDFKLIKSKCQTKTETIFEEFHKSNSRLLTWLEPGDQIDKDFALNAINVFNMNTIGVCFPGKYEDESINFFDTKALVPIDRFKLDSVFECKYEIAPFIVRKTSLIDLEQYFKSNIKIDYTKTLFRGMLFWMLHKGWQITIRNELGVNKFTKPKVHTFNKETIDEENLKLIAQIVKDGDESQFYRYREQFNFTIPIPEASRKNSREYIKLLT